MKKPAFLSNERLSRLMTALLLALGLLWPMLWALGVESAFLTATLATAALTALMTFQAAGEKSPGDLLFPAGSAADRAVFSCRAAAFSLLRWRPSRPFHCTSTA